MISPGPSASRIPFPSSIEKASGSNGGEYRYLMSEKEPEQVEQTCSEPPSGGELGRETVRPIAPAVTSDGELHGKKAKQKINRPFQVHKFIGN